MRESDFYNSQLALVRTACPEVAEQMEKELHAQRKRAKLIASENYNSPAVLAAMSSMLVDKYAEGNVGNRYYSGCEQVDAIEQLAVDEAKELFGAEYAYVQPCSGSDANLMAYYAIIKKIRERKGEGYKPKLLSLDVSCGGHLTHSNPLNIVNELFEVYTYGVNEEGWIDYGKVAEQALEVKPDVVLAGYSAYPRKIDFSEFRMIADSVGAVLMCDMAHFAGLVAGKVFDGVYNPVPFCDIITSTTQKTLRAGRGGIVLARLEWEAYISRSCPACHGGPLNNMVASKAVGFAEAMKPEFREYANRVVENSKSMAEELMANEIAVLTGGTDNHLMIVDLRNLGITGKQAEDALLACDIVVNRNSIPNDPESPLITSGLRIGPAALTTRGLDDKNAAVLAWCISEVLKNTKPQILKSGKPSKKLFVTDEKVAENVRQTVASVLDMIPLYPKFGA